MRKRTRFEFDTKRAFGQACLVSILCGVMTSIGVGIAGDAPIVGALIVVIVALLCSVLGVNLILANTEMITTDDPE